MQGGDELTPPGASSSGVLPPPIAPGAVPGGASHTPPGGVANRARLLERMRNSGVLPPVRGSKRTADTPPDDPRLTSTGPEAETVGGSPRGTKRQAEDPPDDLRLVGKGPEAEIAGDTPNATGPPTSHRPASAISESTWTCATCKEEIISKNKLHRHLRDKCHQVTGDDEQPELHDSSDDEDDSSEEQRRMRASGIRQAILEHYSTMNVTRPDGSVTGSRW